MLANRLAANATQQDPGAGIILNDPFLPVTIDRREGASFVLKGILKFESWNSNRDPIYIKLGKGSSLTIGGDFTLGAGCRIILEPGAELFVGGRRNESGSGVTERCLIMVRKRMVIGVDTIVAWGCFITDCDWHEIAGQSSTEETVIGEHVWLAPNCSILKGSRIGNGCIVATGSVTNKATFPEGCLIGGVPARILAKGRKWKRDLDPLPAELNKSVAFNGVGSETLLGQD